MENYNDHTIFHHHSNFLQLPEKIKINIHTLSNDLTFGRLFMK